MQFYNTTDQENSLVHECWDLCDADNTSYPFDPTVVRRFNLALEEIVGFIINIDGSWQFDDTNYTDLPIGTGTLVASQQSYTFAVDYLDIEEIAVLDSDDYWRRLLPIDSIELGSLTIDEYFGNTNTTVKTGMPTHYDLIGDTIKIYPAPDSDNVTLSSGFRVKFHRTADLFTTSDTSQEPPLPSPYHQILAYMAAIPYCMTYKKDRVARYEKKVEDIKKELIKHYTRREKDRKKIMTTSTPAFR